MESSSLGFWTLLLIKKALFGLLLLVSHLKAKTIFVFRILLKNKRRALALFVIFLGFLSLFETLSWFKFTLRENLLGRALNQSWALNSIEWQPAPRAPKKADFRIASLERGSEEEEGPYLTEEGVLIAPEKELSSDQPLTRTETETYEVKEGDSLYLIADRFNLSLDTLLWENNLSLRSIIRPGQQLKILPVDGLTHKVKKGETLGKIALKYKSKVEEIIEFNGLADARDIFAGDELLIPYGKKPFVPAPAKPAPKKYFVYPQPTGGNCHRFYPGQCTWYVARQRCIPWTGNANRWISHARNMGFQIGYTPQNGAVISLKETGWAARRYGHVAYVESFTGSTVTFSEMNYGGPWIKTTRTLPINDPRILGYIY